MNRRSLLRCGAAGSVITAICCFTPVLAVLLPAAGLAAWLGWVDWALLPALAAFLGLTAYAVHQVRRERGAQVPPAGRRADAEARQMAKKGAE